ncbi:MAG: 50S ribosomal protein L16 [Hadesarchaea archaeon]|nr:50S ribosomal protein L16 [Hadesarchaea archaeon]
MPLRPGRAYRHFSGPAYTRKEFIKRTPGIRVILFDRGNPDRDFPVVMTLIADEKGQIRHNALEAARVAANRVLESEAGRNNYHLKLRIYPHQILRENPMAVGAGADRISDGMRLAFGKPIGAAARVTSGQKILTVRVPKEFVQLGKEALRRAAMKLPIKTRRIFEKGGELIGS